MTLRQTPPTVADLPLTANAMNKIRTSSESSKRAGSARDIRSGAGSVTVTSLEDRGRAAALAWLGGAKFWSAPAANPSGDDPTLARGALAHGAITVLVCQLRSLKKEEIAEVLGVSTRTLRRYRETPRKRTRRALEARAWTVAETLANASEILGGKEEAEHWFSRPVMGLDGRRPMDLLQSVEGAQLVRDFLGRLEHGVYC